MPKRITNKQRVWLARYLSNGLNATEAARYAEYKQPQVSGFENLEKLRNEIATALQKKAMPKDEVLALIADQARASLLDVAEITEYDSETGEIKAKISPEAAIKNGKAHLVQSVTYDRAGRPQLKLHSAQRALDMLMRAHGLYKDGATPDQGEFDEWSELLERRRKKNGR